MDEDMPPPQEPLGGRGGGGGGGGGSHGLQPKEEPKIAEQTENLIKIVLPKNLFDNKITLINYEARFDMRR